MVIVADALVQRGEPEVIAQAATRPVTSVDDAHIQFCQRGIGYVQKFRASFANTEPVARTSKSGRVDDCNDACAPRACVCACANFKHSSRLTT